MKDILHRLHDFFFVPPVYSDPKQTRVAELLYKVLPVLPLTAAVNFLAAAVVPENILRYVALAASIILLDVILLLLIRRGSAIVAANAASIFGWLIVTVLCITGGGIRAPAFMAYSAIILGSGILLGSRAGVVTTAATVFAGFMMAWMETHGYLPEPRAVLTPYSVLINLCAILTLVLLTHYGLMYTLDRALTSSHEELVSRRRAEEQATRNRAILSSVFDSTRDMIVAVDREMRIIALNAPLIARTRQIAGFEPMIGMHLDYIIPEDRRGMVHEVQERVMNGEQVVLESSSPVDGGRPLYFEESYSPIVAADGTIQGFTIYIRNITERRRAEEALQRSKEDLERHIDSLRAINEISQTLHQALDIGTIARAAVDALVTYSRSPRVAFLLLDQEKQEFRRLAQYGFGEESLRLGETMPLEGSLSGVAVERRNVVTSDEPIDDSRVHPAVAHGLSSEEVKSAVSIPLLFQDEVLGVVDLVFMDRYVIDGDERATLLAIGKTIGLAMANARHIARIEAEVIERQRAESALQYSEERYRRLVENSNILVAEVLEDGQYAYVNAAHRRILGYPPDLLVGTNIADLIHPEDRGSVLAQGMSDQGVALFRFRHADGTYRWLDATSRLLSTITSERHHVLIASDVTERVLMEETKRQLEQQLLQSQKLEAIGTLAGGIAHDFNNILVSLLGNAELAKLKLEVDHPVQKYLARLMEGSERARDLVQQILAFSRRQESERKPVQVQSVIKEALKLMRASIPATIGIRSEFMTDPPYVQADLTQIHQIVVNLCANAAHAMERSGGRLEVTERAVMVDETIRRLSPDLRIGRYYVLAIRDTGQGIDSRILPRIFEPFFTTKEPGKGTGLGLSVVHGIVRNHDGAITVKSEAGFGTLFEVYLPVAAREEEKREAQRIDHAVGHGEHILLVDDEVGIIDTAVDILAELGYRVTAFHDAAEAFKAFALNPNDYQVVLTDLTMPRMTGLELARAIVETRPDLPVVLATGYQQLEDPEAIWNAGIRAVIAKPFRVSAIADVLRSVLERNVSSEDAKDQRNGRRPGPQT